VAFSSEVFFLHANTHRDIRFKGHDSHSIDEGATTTYLNDFMFELRKWLRYMYQRVISRETQVGITSQRNK
jgi:hypothetical protein